jgi:glycosyltransferase involved in cell wall biosynthesis
MSTEFDWNAVIDRALAEPLRLDRVELAALEARKLRADEARAARTAEELRSIKSSDSYRTAQRLARAKSALRPRTKRTPSDSGTAENAAVQHKESAADERRRRLAALTSRIRTLLAEFAAQGGPASQTGGNDQELPAALDLLANLISDHPQDRPLLWLTHIAITARYPSEEAMRRFHSDIAVNGSRGALEQLLLAQGRQKPTWSLFSDLELVRSVAVDASATSHRSFHTGIQRVVREIVPRWSAEHDIRLIVWGGGAKSFRNPSESEIHHIMSFDPGVASADDIEEDFDRDCILVPWRTVVVVPEVITNRYRADALACLATWSGSELSVLFYDFLVYSMPEGFMDSTRVNFASFIQVVRSSHRVSAISAAVAHDVRDFGLLFARLALTPPDVRAQVLPVVRADVAPANGLAARADLLGESDRPMVLSVGSIEPRKNQLTTLRAAELLWQDGLDFQLVFIGWHGWGTEWFDDEIARLQANGRPVRVISEASEDLLWTAYRSAAFSVYISFAEGYGLPPAESIACGTPVILSDIGSMTEVAKAGGAILVDPADLGNVTAQMRTLLTDSQAQERLRREIDNVQGKTWEEYASETWDWLVKAEPISDEPRETAAAEG